LWLCPPCSSRIFIDNAVTYFALPIVKHEKADNGDLIVYGKATDDIVDSDGQIIDAEFARKGLQRWLSSGGNVRVMHSTNLYPAGVGLELAGDDHGQNLRSAVVEPTAKLLVSKGVLTSYSVGIARPKIIRDREAPGGRVVDGEFVEVSLVDRPANSNCKFAVAGTGDNGEATSLQKFVQIDEAAIAALLKADDADAECGLCHGSGKIREGHVTCPDCHGSGKLADVSDEKREAQRRRAEGKTVDPELEKRDFDKDVGGGVDRDKIPAEDFAGPNRTYPIVTPGDVSDAARLIGKADDKEEVKSNIIRIAERKGKEFVAQLPDSWTKKMETPYILTRLHDLTCAAYDPEAVLDQYAGVRSTGLAKFIADAPDAIKGLLAKQLVGGDGAQDIAQTGLIMAAAVGAVEATKHREAEADLQAIREDMHKAFKGVNPGRIPTIGSPVEPGSYHRPYISAGHAKEGPTGKPHIPASGQSLDPDRFDREKTIPGDAADSPGDAGGNNVGAPTGSSATRTFYTNAARDAAHTALAALHDHIASTFPDLCPMADNRTNKAMGELPGLHDVAPLEGVAPSNLENAVGVAPGETKAAEAELVKAAISAAVAEERSKWEPKVAELQEQIDILGSKADPAQAPYRGAAWTSGLPNVVKNAVDETATQELREITERIDILRKIANVGTPELRLQAQELLGQYESGKVTGKELLRK